MPLAADLVATSETYDESTTLTGRAPCDLDEYAAPPRTRLTQHHDMSMLGISLWCDGLQSSADFQTTILEQTWISYERAQRVGALLGGHAIGRYASISSEAGM